MARSVVRPPPDGSPILRSVSNALWAYIHMLEASCVISRRIGRNAVGHAALCQKTGSLRRRRRSLTVIGGGDGAAGRRKGRDGAHAEQDLQLVRSLHGRNGCTFMIDDQGPQDVREVCWVV